MEVAAEVVGAGLGDVYRDFGGLAGADLRRVGAGVVVTRRADVRIVFAAARDVHVVEGLAGVHDVERGRLAGRDGDCRALCALVLEEKVALKEMSREERAQKRRTNAALEINESSGKPRLKFIGRIIHRYHESKRLKSEQKHQGSELKKSIKNLKDLKKLHKNNNYK